MDNKKYLTEENYEKGKKKIKNIALIILIVGILFGGSLIVTGLVKQEKNNSQYLEENKNNKQEQLEKEKQKQQLKQEYDVEKQNLLTSKANLENKIKPVEDEIKKLKREKKDVFMNGGYNDKYYEIEDKIEELNKSIENDKNSLVVIEDVLDESFEDCDFPKAKNNNYTSKYCSLKNQISKKSTEISILEREYSDFNKKIDSFDSIPFYMFGGFIILASCIISLSVYMISKRREIAAFSVQQMMPIAQEGIETIAPTVAKTGKEVIKEMAPAYGEVAKEISKGIKDGMKDEEK